MSYIHTPICLRDSHTASPPGCARIDSFDAHLFAAGRSHASAASSLNSGDVIEIQGPPASGKTHLLYYLVMTAILPTEFVGSPIDGWDKAAVIYDTDGTFDIQRLHKLLVSRIAHILPQNSAEHLALAALKRVHVFRPTSSIQLAMTLASFPDYHMTSLLDDDVGLVAVDSVSSFYWPDRFTMEQLNSATVQHGTSHIPTSLQYILSALQKIRLSYGTLIVVTNWGLNPLTNFTGNSVPTTLYKQHLKPFPVIPSRTDSNLPDRNSSSLGLDPNLIPSNDFLLPLMHHITLPFVSIAPFGPGLLLADMETEEAKYRTAIVTKGEIVGIVRTRGSSRVGRFAFDIRDDEVVVGDGGK